MKIRKYFIVILLTSGLIIQVLIACSNINYFLYNSFLNLELNHNGKSLKEEEDSKVDIANEDQELSDTLEEDADSESTSTDDDLQLQNDQSSGDSKVSGNGDNESQPDPEPEPEPQIVMCLGDSVTYGHPYGETNNTYPAKLQMKLNAAYGSSKVTVVNHGVGGYRADQVLAGLSTWLVENPDVVLIMVGGNDLLQGLSPESTPEEVLAVINQTVSEVQQIVTLCKAHLNPDGSHPKVILSAFIPNNYEDVWGSAAIALYNSGLSGGVSGEDVWFTDNWNDLYDADTFQAKLSLMSDSVHPNASGYSIIANNWYSRVTPYITQ